MATPAATNTIKRANINSCFKIINEYSVFRKIIVNLTLIYFFRLYNKIEKYGGKVNVIIKRWRIFIDHNNDY